MTDSESSDSPQTKLLFECSQALQAKDLDFIAKYFHKDFRVVSYPRSLGIPEQTKEEWLERWAGITSLLVGDFDVSYIGCLQIPLAVTEFLSQHDIRLVSNTPGRIIYHVRI
jgi:hypothetical protein